MNRQSNEQNNQAEQNANVNSPQQIQNQNGEQNTNVNPPQQTQNQNGEQNTNVNSPPQQTQNGGFPGFTGIFFPIFGGRPRSSPDDNNSQQEVPGEAQIQFFIYPLPGTQGDGQTTPGVFFFVPQQEVRKPRASESAINRLPIITITKELVDSQASCPICLEPFPLSIGQEENEKTGRNVPVRQMPCNHMFCESCLFQWLRQNNSCPLCRKEIEAEAEAQQNDNNGATLNVPLFGMMNIVNSPPPSQTTTNTVQSNSHSSHSSHPHNSQNSRSSCALESVGCCEETENHVPMPIITLPQCHHRFHASCLRTSLLVEGYSQGDFNSTSQPLNFRCPTCRSPAIVPSEMLKMSVTPHDERQEQPFNLPDDMDLD